VQANDTNYLIPVEEVESDTLLDVDALAVQWVLQRIEAAGCHLNLVFLDCCRSKPPKMTASTKALSKGLAKIEAPTGTLVSFACAPGAVASDGEQGRNGVYTEQLLQHLPRAEDVQKVLGYVVSDVQKVTKGAQVPWMSGTLARDPNRNGGDIFLIEPQTQSPTPAPASPTTRSSSLSALEEAAAAGADVVGLSSWLTEHELGKHEAAIVPKLAAIGVHTVSDLLKLTKDDIKDMKLLKMEERTLMTVVAKEAENARLQQKADSEKMATAAKLAQAQQQAKLQQAEADAAAATARREMEAREASKAKEESAAADKNAAEAAAAAAAAKRAAAEEELRAAKAKAEAAQASHTTTVATPPPPQPPPTREFQDTCVGGTLLVATAPCWIACIDISDCHWTMKALRAMTCGLPCTVMCKPARQKRVRRKLCALVHGKTRF
jgi:chemotaxis protein histidine kinase CheA